MRYEGGCHCGAVRLIFETALDPRETPVRACQCSFCRKHNTLAIADPTALQAAVRGLGGEATGGDWDAVAFLEDLLRQRR